MRGTYERKIFIIYLTLLIFLITIISGGAAYYGFSNAQKERKFAREQLALSKQQQLDIQLNIAFSSLIQVKTSPLIETWAFSKQGEFNYNSLKIKNNIMKQQLSLESLNFLIGVSLVDENRSVINQYNTQSKKEYYENVLGLSNPDPAVLYKELKQIKSYNKYLFKSGLVEGKKKINYITLHNLGDTEIIFYLTIDEKIFYSSILGLDDGWLINYNEAVISSNLSEQLSYLDEIDIKNIVKTSFASIQNDDVISYKDLRVHNLKSRQQNISFIYIYEKERFLLIQNLGLFLLLYIILCLISFFVAKIITSFLYKPITEVVDNFSGNRDKNKGFNEFKYINLKTEEIKNDNIQLKSLVLKNSNLLLEKFHKDLLYGINTSKVDSYRSFPIKNGSYKVVLFNIEEGEETLDDDILFLVKNSIRSTVSNSEKSLFVNIDHNSFVLINRVENDENIEDEIKQIIKNIEKEFDVIVIASIGKTVDDLKKIKVSFNEANRIMEYKSSVGIKQILTIEDLKSFRDYNYFFPLNIENRLISNILNGNKIETKKIVDLLLDENLLIRNLSFDRKRNFLFSLMSTINRIQQEKKIEGELFDNEMTYILDILSLEDNKKIRTKVHEVFEQIIGTVSSDQNNIKNIMADQIMKYIHNNYDWDISLYDVSQHLNITESYSSILFKRVTGENFKDVLNKYRIEQAKQLLEENSQIKIKELAKRVGFNSSNTFIRVFKKYVGLSPGVYIDKK